MEKRLEVKDADPRQDAGEDLRGTSGMSVSPPDMREMRFGEAMRAGSVGIVIYSADGRIVDVNRTFEGMCGYTVEELRAMGRPGAAGLISSVGVAEDRAPGGETLPYEKQMQRKDGSSWWALCAPARLDGSNQERRWAEYVIDITERKRAQEALETELRERARDLAATEERLRQLSDESERTENSRLRSLRRLLNAHELERQRIAHELHEHLGQQLSAVCLKLSILKQQKYLHVYTRQALDEIEHLARDADNGLDFLVWDLRPTALDELGLLDALHSYLHSWSARFHVEVRLHADGPQVPRLDTEIETVFYRAAQEALHNFARHSRVRRVTVTFARGSREALLTIRDESIEFGQWDPLHGEKEIGLLGVRERVALVNGEVTFDSKPGYGTAFCVRVPLA